MKALVAIALAACHPRVRAPALPPLPPAGISISIYDSYAVVDDRRWITTAGTTLELDHIDPGAALASLTIESDLHAGTCRRSAAATGVVRCDMTAAPGRHLVRVLYVSRALHYRALHDITVTGARATIASRFSIDTPAWGGHAELALFDGEPGGDHVPREVARGTIALDGATAELASVPRDVPATLSRIYDGAVLDDALPNDAAWGRESQTAVWVWLELEGVTLASGAVRVHTGDRDVVVAPDAGVLDRGLLRLPLWSDPDLHGSRQRFVDLGAGAGLAERVVLAVTNAGAAPREVWAVEHMRPARHHRIEHAWPSRPVVDGEVVRTKLVVKPGAVERTGFTIAYDY